MPKGAGDTSACGGQGQGRVREGVERGRPWPAAAQLGPPPLCRVVRDAELCWRWVVPPCARGETCSCASPNTYLTAWSSYLKTFPFDLNPCPQIPCQFLICNHLLSEKPATELRSNFYFVLCFIQFCVSLFIEVPSEHMDVFLLHFTAWLHACLNHFLKRTYTSSVFSIPKHS